MKLARASRKLGLVTLIAIASPIVMADDTGWYAGVNVGQSRATIDDDGITGGLLDKGFATSSITEDERSTGYKLFGGYQFNKYFALEGGYFNLGDFGFTATTVPAGTLQGNIEIQGLNLDAVGILPISEKFSAFGRVGLNYADSDVSFAGTGSVIVLDPNPSKRDMNYKFGVGLQYAITESLTMRAEAERYRIDDAVGNVGDIDLFSVGLLYRFGAKTHAPAHRAAAPEPAPEVIAAAPAAPRFEKYTLSATELFAFDSAKLRKPQSKLDEIADALNSNSEIDNVVITGYTDRIGSEQYNQRLSERRAIAVKNYLTGKGIDGNRLKAEGKGEANPVVECTDKNRSALIECLEPNRRVEVEQITIERRLQ
ncbi:MAG: OmpA family protein [Gammaproteobacteria bacterium]